VVHARPDRRSVQEVVEGNEILPVHRAHYPGELHSESGLAVVAYLLVYGGQPIANPYWSQLVSAPLQLVTGRRAMWLFLVSAEVRPKERRAAEAAALEWLGEAWHRYQTACSP
jgi:hypothetical protein